MISFLFGLQPKAVMRAPGQPSLPPCRGVEAHSGVAQNGKGDGF